MHIDHSMNQPSDVHTPADVAQYIATMLESLQSLADRNSLSILSLMLAMAMEQAKDDSNARR